MNGDTPEKPDSTPPESPWQYKSERKSATAPTPVLSQPAPPADEPEEVTWTASEFIHHDKGIGWFAILGLVIIVLNVLIYLLTHDVISVVALTAMGILFGVMAGRKPRTLNYVLNARGLMLGSTFHPYGEFRSFAIMQDNAFPSIMFIPVKRFMPPISIYYDPKDEEKIIDVLGSYLPVEFREHDTIDNFSKRIRL